MKRKLHILLAAGIGLTASVGWTHAENITVGDVTALKNALTGTADTIKLSKANYELTEQLSIGRSIVILGPTAAGDSAVIKTTDDKNAFIITTTDGTVVLNNLYFKGDKTFTLSNDSYKNSAAIGFPGVANASGTNEFAGKLVLDKVDISGYFFGINCGAVDASKIKKNTIEVNNSKFFECLHKAIYTESSDITIKGTTFEDCATEIKGKSGWFTAVAVDINLKYTNYDKVEITGSTFKHNGIEHVTPPTAEHPQAVAYSVALGIKARNDGSYTNKPAVLKAVTVSDNKFINNSLGIQFGEPKSKGSNVLTAITLADNNTFTGNYNDVINISSNTTIASSVKNVKGLQDALADAAAGAQIKLAEGTYSLATCLKIEKPITIEGSGDKTIFQPTADFNKSFSGDGGDKYLITAYKVTDGLNLKNFIADGTPAKDVENYRGNLNIVASKNAVITNVTSRNSKAAGLVVNASTVTATGLKTSGNPWGGVNLSVGSDSKETPTFTFDATSSFAEVQQVYVQLADPTGTVNTPAGWESYKVADALHCWTNTKTKNITSVAELGMAVAIARDGDMLNLANGTYDLAKSLTITKGITIQGTDSAKCIIKGNLEINATEPASVVLNKLTLTEDASKTTATATAMIHVKSNNADLSLNHVLVNPVAPGTSTDRRACIYLSDSKITSSKIAMNNSTFLLTKSSLIGLLVIDARCDFSMDNSRIISDENADKLDGLKTILSKAAVNSTFKINNSLLSVGNNFHYAIWVQRSKQQFVINNSQVNGWAAFYMQGAWVQPNGIEEVTLTAKNSSFTGVGKSGSSNGFGVIVFEAVKKSTIDMDNCKVTSKVIGDTKDFGFIPPFVFQVGGANSVTAGRVLDSSSDCHVRLKDCTVQNSAEATTPVMIDYNNICVFDSDGGQADLSKLDGYMDYKNRVYVEGNTQFLNQDGSKSIVIQATDTLRNAAATLPNAIAYMNGEIHIPVAYHGDIVQVSNTALAAAMKSLNDAKDQFKEYTLPDSVIIICKDGYLVSGKTAANNFAEKNSDKPVFHLALASANGTFTNTAVASKRKQISGNMTIDATNKGDYENRSIELAKNANLTIDVALNLDSVIFLTDTAMLKTAANVNANVLQLNYRIQKDKWKAFGFPASTGLTAKKGEDVVTFASASSGPGNWLATVAKSANSDRPAFALQTAMLQAAIIATDQADQQITVTGTAVNLTTKPEANQPAAGTVGFTFAANPNTHPIQLIHTAYVLSADGTTFERTEGATIPAFGSYILADAGTTSTLRSLRVDGGSPTGNEIVAAEGYFVKAGKGFVEIHTADPVQVMVVDMLGRVYYNARVTTDGYQIALPAGIYAVNRQKVVVK